MGIQILNSGTGFRPTMVDVKVGRIASGRNRIAGHPFGYPGRAIGNVEYRDTFATLPSDSLATVVPRYDKHPLSGFHNTATIAPLPPMANDRDAGNLAPLNPHGPVPMIQVHERNALPFPKIPEKVKPVNSVNEKSDTPFHPKKRPKIARSIPRSGKTAERTLAPSFTLHSTGTHHGGVFDHDRWAKVKRGAAG